MKTTDFFSGITLHWLNELPFRVSRWHEGLQVWQQTQQGDFVAATMPHNLFGSDGLLLPPLKAQLPTAVSYWLAQIPLTLRQAVGQLAANKGQIEPGGQWQFDQILMLRLMQNEAYFAEWLMQMGQQRLGGYFKALSLLAKLDSLHWRLQESFWLYASYQKRENLLGDLLLDQGGSLFKAPLQAKQLKPLANLSLAEEWSPSLLVLFFNLQNQVHLHLAMLDINGLRLQRLAAFNDLPTWLQLPNLMQVINQIDTPAITRIFPPVILGAFGSLQTQLQQSLKTVKTPWQLEHKLHEWANNLALEVDFPPPPFAGSALLSPIINGKQLKQEGDDLQHCVAGYAQSVLKGENYFYHWQGDNHLPRAATLQLKPYAKSSQWFLYEALGKQNFALSEPDWQYLRQQIANLNRPWGYLLLKTQIAGLEYSDYAHCFHDLKPFETLQIRHERSNAFDSQAMVLLRQTGEKLGYIPKTEQAVLLPYLANMDLLQCRLNFIKPHYATINVYLAPQISI